MLTCEEYCEKYIEHINKYNQCLNLYGLPGDYIILGDKIYCRDDYVIYHDKLYIKDFNRGVSIIELYEDYCKKRRAKDASNLD